VKRLVLVMTCLAGAAVAFAAETAKPPAEPGANAAPAALAKPADAPAADAKAAELKGPHLVVEPPTHDFGKVLQNKTVTKEFTIKNTGTEDLVISEVTTSCGCTAASLTTKSLKPGASTALGVSVDTRSTPGKLERYVTITSNDAQKKTLVVTVSADVQAGTAPAAQ
jgi:hypothetical protein